MPNRTREASQMVVRGLWTFVNRVALVRLTMALPPVGLDRRSMCLRYGRSFPRVIAHPDDSDKTKGL